MTWARRLRGANNEGILAALILVISIVMAIASPAFLTASTFFALVRSSMVPLVFALGVLLIMISGGIDVSFAAIAIFAAYTTVLWASEENLDPTLVGVFAIALVIGAVLGSLNGVIIARFRLPTLIVTLGTQGIFKGIMLAYIGSVYISTSKLPPSVLAGANAHLLDVHGGGYLHAMILPVAALVFGVWWMLKYSTFGRSVYAIGGDAEAARRVGINVVRTQVVLYVIVGVLAAFGGVTYVLLGKNANPQTLVGSEMDIIAAVVLGGASIFGGRGSVLGTVLGVVLVQLINNNLVLIGVPSTWQRAAVGVLLLLGVGAQAVAASRVRRAPMLVQVEGADA